jgi:4-hydroxy-tetrahydrodipicolinate synthase
MLFEGSCVAVVTPFDQDGQIDFEMYAKLLDWHIEQGTDAILTCGTTGEAATMNDSEHKSVMKFAVDHVAGRVPVIAGTGSNDTAYAIQLSQYAESVGADGLLVVAPYYNKSTQEGMIAHFTAIADAVNTPIILYNVPGRTGINIAASTVAVLAAHPNICGVKEASGNITQCADIARLCPDDFQMWSGNDDMIVPLLSLGGSGVISVVANIMPKETSELVHAYLDGDTKRALDLQLGMNALVHQLFVETNPIPVKKAMSLMGLCGGTMRLPLIEIQAKNEATLVEEMKNTGLLEV